MKPKKIIIHHSACMDSNALEWSAIRRYHIVNNGWADIGYHAGVEMVAGSYEALYGRPLDSPGAHALGHNKESLGICLVGDFTSAPPPDEQMAVAARIVNLWLRLFGIPVDAIFKHSDVNETECPGAAFPWARFMDIIRQLPLL